MGTVYLARDPDLPRSDALKVLAPELSHDPDFRRRFAREAEVAAALDHPNIVAIRRRGEFTGQLWIAMQFVDGPDADAALRSGAMTPTRALRITSEVAEALDYAHQHNVVHRDVKPANFLLSHTPTARERVLLGDFGIARALDDTQLTGAGGPTASVAYVAPEVLAGFAFDGRADVYSLGCSLFRMLTGKTPFSTANGMMAVMMAHLQAPPPKVTDLVPGLPAQLDNVIATAMAKDPAHRFGSARQLAAAAAETFGHTAPHAVRPVPGAAVSAYTGPPPPAAPPTGQYGDPRTPPGATATPAGAPLQWAAPAARRRRRTRIAAGVSAAAVAAVAAVTAVSLLRNSGTDTPSSSATTGTTVTTATTPVPTSTPAKVAAVGLDRLLLSANEISAILVGDPMYDEPVHASLYDDTATVPDRDCIGVFLPAQGATYTGSGWEAAAAQIFHAPGAESWQKGALEAVVEFPSAQRAQKSLADQGNAWKKCADHAITSTPIGGTEQHWTFGQPKLVDGTWSIRVAPDGSSVSCERAIGVRSNAVIDVSACRDDATTQASTIVRDIGAKITQS